LWLEVEEEPTARTAVTANPVIKDTTDATVRFPKNPQKDIAAIFWVICVAFNYCTKVMAYLENRAEMVDRAGTAAKEGDVVSADR
jgi:hypothetical protein